MLFEELLFDIEEENIETFIQLLTLMKNNLNKRGLIGEVNLCINKSCLK